MLEVAAWVIPIYFIIGGVVTGILSQTPYADNPWWLTTMLWPLFVYGLVRG